MWLDILTSLGIFILFPILTCSLFDTSLTEGVKICFYGNTAGERGTEIAMYEYADYSERLLKMKSHIIFPRIIETSNVLSDLADKTTASPIFGGAGCRASLAKFQKRFNVSFCGEPYSEELLDNINKEISSTEDNYIYPICNNLALEAKRDFSCDLLYVQKGGLLKSPPQYPDAFGVLPTMVHAVFNWEPHGNVYAGISPAIKAYRPRDRGNIVPYMVKPPDPALLASAHSYREHFNIPKQALVVCRHGGDESFNLHYVKHAIITLIQQYNESQLQFLFLGTDHFKHELIQEAKHTNDPQLFIKNLNKTRKQIHFIPTTSNEGIKENYFRTCDCMLHARDIGETFGLAIAEFSIRNKPIITQQAGKRYSDFHIKILKEKGYYYNNEATVVRKISHFVENGVPKDVDFNCYREFTPENVMHTFKKLFLDAVIPLIGKENVGSMSTVW